MNFLHDWLFQLLWASWGLVWLAAAALGGKAVHRREPLLLTLEHGGAIFAAALLVGLPRLPGGLLGGAFLPRSELGFFAGAALLVGGLALALWARLHLGTNWSGTVTLKAGHELVRTGPYALVRHPIYTGLISGFLGSALARAEWRGLLALLLVAFTHWRKAHREERWLGERFGAAYRRYREEVPMLVPFL